MRLDASLARLALAAAPALALLAGGCDCAATGDGRDAGRDGGASDAAGGIDASSGDPDARSRPDAATAIDAHAPPDAGPPLATCAACEDHLECGSGNVCALLTDGVRACAPSCDPDLPECPAGFRCVVDVLAAPEPACLPVGERCCVDVDGDLHGAGVGCLGADCDESDDGVHEGAAELCDGRDDDCDGATDEGATQTFFADTDGDGFGNAGAAHDACVAPPGHVEDATDCDDARMDVSPAAAEVCDAANIDEDCDGERNEGCMCADGETRGCGLPGACAAGLERCVGGAFGACSVTAGAESCDGTDEDCDGLTDEGVTRAYRPDADGDGFGDARAAAVDACAAPAGHVEDARDCDDARRDVSPAGTERCDAAATDEDCDGVANEGCACIDGTMRSCPEPGVCAAGTQSCASGAWSACSITPTTETCEGSDQDCDGTVDEPPAAASCPIAGSECTSGTCVCPPGHRVCSTGARCIGGLSCCTNADCGDAVCDGGTCRPGLGCASGRRRGFYDEAQWPSVAACGSAAGYVDATSAAAAVCAPGWHGCSAAEISALSGPAPSFDAPGMAWVDFVDATTTWWAQHSDAACGPSTVFANLRGTASCTASGAFPEGWRLAISGSTWGISHTTSSGCVTHVAHSCGFAGGSVTQANGFTLCCQ